MSYRIDLSDRNLISLTNVHLPMEEDAADGQAAVNLTSNGSLTNDAEGIIARFPPSDDPSQVGVKLSSPVLGNGVSISFKVWDWDDIKYIAIGYTTDDNEFVHIKVPNPAQGKWVQISCCHHDVLFAIQNGWETPGNRNLKDVRLYVKTGDQSREGFACVRAVAAWADAPKAAARDLLTTQEVRTASEPLIATLYDYWRTCIPEFAQQADEFLRLGTVPLQGGNVAWDPEGRLPADFDNGTHRYSWFALTPVSIYLLGWHETRNEAFLYASRDFFNSWYESSYLTPDPDQKYNWYDHGVAERLMTLVMLWDVAERQAWDHRFKVRLLGVIMRHAQLLENEAFYAFYQSTRFHNHAWFQDAALAALGAGLPWLPKSRYRLELAHSRLSDQFAQLISREQDYSVFVENSIGYHHGVRRLIKLVGDLFETAGDETDFREILHGLDRFSDAMQYADGRSPSQGDTFRKANPAKIPKRARQPHAEPMALALEESGYGIVHGNCAGIRYDLRMFATALTRTHKHDDNLSFTLYFDGIEWLIDPSFYSHDYTAEIPAYLRSVWAHNTVALELEGYDAGPGTASLSGTRDGETFALQGAHTSYPGTTVKRSVEGRLDDLALHIHEQVESNDTPQAHAVLHLGEGVEAKQMAGGVKLTHPLSAFTLEVLAGDTWQIVTGADEHPSIRSLCGLGFLASRDSTQLALAFRDAVNWQLRVAPAAPAD